MKTKNLSLFKVLAFCCAIALLASCDDSSEPMGKGDVEFEITDAPSDDASIKGVFITISDIQIEGRSVEGFTKQTIDLKAYQEGNTKLLVTGQQLDAKTYSNLTLVLDLDADAAGNTPGCYVLTLDDMKYKLKSTSSGTAEITTNKDWSVIPNTTTKIVMDFDLRKSIVHAEDPSVRYSFVSDNLLESAVRVVVKDKAGNITGSYQEGENLNADKTIVYAYTKGTFNASTETEAQDENSLLFANAVTSAEVKSGVTGKTFTLALLEEGEYELHFAAHTENSGKMMFNTLLTSETIIGGVPGDIVNVEAGATVVVTGTIDITL